MLVKGIKDEDFTNYKYPSMFIATCYCDWKCCIEKGYDLSICQNQPLMSEKNINIPISYIVDRYMKNSISKSVVFGGLEPIMQIDDILRFIEHFRKFCKDDIIIYTGYNENEILEHIKRLKRFENIIIKFGRFINNNTPTFDDVLGVSLASSNQYAVKIS